MSIRAIIVDVYQTILEVGPPPADADRRWTDLWVKLWGRKPRLTLGEFAHQTTEVIGREHAEARALGVPYPEIYWPVVAAEVLPELNELSPTQKDEFYHSHAVTQRTLKPMEGAADALRIFSAHQYHLGIASNAQPYTLREWGDALASERLSPSIFHPDLLFWSFRSGFSKPDPHVYRWLSARLWALGVSPAETLMVGDRLDNDIVPAQAQGWLTWQLTPTETAGEHTPAGRWPALVDYVLAAEKKMPGNNGNGLV